MFEPPPLDPGIEIHLASRGYSKGLAQTDGGQLLIRGELASGPLFVQAYWKNVDSARASGESGFLIGARTVLGGVAIRATAAYKHQTGVSGPVDEDAFEFAVEASRQFGRFTPRLNLTWSPDELGGTRHSLYAEASASFRVLGHTSLFASVGRRERSGGDDYTAFSAGLSQQVGDHVTAELRWNDTARSSLGDAFEGRAVAALRVRF
jgi:hypothetical protein